MQVAYGPLSKLIGTFQGDKGLDIAPEPDGVEENPFYETITFSEVGYVKNAEEQQLAAIHYHQIVTRKSDNTVFHNQTGYWMWDQEANQIIQSIAIPRAVCLLAAGEALIEDNGKIIVEVRSDAELDTWGIVQSPFMHAKAKTTSYEHTMTLVGDELHYTETTLVDIYGQKSFEHVDSNTLKKV